MERRPISVKLHKIKVNDIKAVIFFTTFKVIYINADNNIIIPQAPRSITSLKLYILIQITT